jgi:hypothetical protein
MATISYDIPQFHHRPKHRQKQRFTALIESFETSQQLRTAGLLLSQYCALIVVCALDAFERNHDCFPLKYRIKVSTVRYAGDLFLPLAISRIVLGLILVARDTAALLASCSCAITYSRSFISFPYMVAPNLGLDESIVQLQRHRKHDFAEFLLENFAATVYSSLHECSA